MWRRMIVLDFSKHAFDLGSGIAPLARRVVCDARHSAPALNLNWMPWQATLIRPHLAAGKFRQGSGSAARCCRRRRWNVEGRPYFNLLSGRTLSARIFAKNFCKSRFQQGLKNSKGRRRDFRVKMRGEPHGLTLNAQATSVRRMRLYESAITSRPVFSRKIARPATSDFCNNICHKATYALQQRALNRTPHPRVRATSAAPRRQAPSRSTGTGTSPPNALRSGLASDLKMNMRMSLPRRGATLVSLSAGSLSIAAIERGWGPARSPAWRRTDRPFSRPKRGIRLLSRMAGCLSYLGPSQAVWSMYLRFGRAGSGMIVKLPRNASSIP
jgi:hypothetical protein